MAKQSIDAALAHRVQWGLVTAGLNVRQLGKVLVKTHQLPDGIEVADAWANGRRLLPHSGLCVAAAINVDGRWLSTGNETPAGAALEVSLRTLVNAGPILRLAIAGSDFLTLLKRLPQPLVKPGVCRYCGSTGNGVAWIDALNSFCSPCWGER